MKKFFIAAFALSFATCYLYGQDTSLLTGVESNRPKKEFVTHAFKSSRVINGHSMELIGKGVLDVRILHRFGTINGGASELFGLDQASMRLGFDYGLGKNLTIGMGRTTFKKELDGFIKWRPVRQARGGSPVSWVLVTGISIYTFKNPDPQKDIKNGARPAAAMRSRKDCSRSAMAIPPPPASMPKPPANMRRTIRWRCCCMRSRRSSTATGRARSAPSAPWPSARTRGYWACAACSSRRSAPTIRWRR